MATLEAPTIQASTPDTGLSIELNSEELRPDKIFTIHSVDSSPMDTQSAFRATTSQLLNQDTQQNNAIHRNSSDIHRNSLTNRRGSKEQEEMNRNRKRHRGRVYRTLTLEESAYYEDYVFCSSSDMERTQEPDKNSDGDNVLSPRKIENKRHTYEYMHYVEQVS